ncbi:DUF6273 domain-containing protein [uncultured Bacteroides sp.]|uniref:DUF6273 domain-containing protein n=1 Tax=uncultured Bacteroides sp. TaxID=162156 RepID=UPI00280B1206|nr:DUF6273 domain-containing protein [uncultured Bacteroides sp.]
MSKKISALSAGSLVKLNENGVAKKYIMLGYNHYGKAEVTLLRKDAAGFRAYNACQSGYNVYNGNSLDSFCNEQHIQCLDPVIRACLVNVPIPTTDGNVNGTWSATVRNLMRKCFSLSAAEVGNGGSDGTAFSYLSTQANRIAYQDETTTAVLWWLRSPYSSYDYRACVVDTDGSVYNNDVSSGDICARPALALSSEILVSDSADSSGCYTIVSAPAGEEYQKVNGVWMRMC